MKKTNYINLTLQMALTDFKLKYSGSILGYVWSLVKPLLLFGVLYVVFTYFFNLGKGIPNYPVYLLIGIMFWSLFAEATMSGMHSVVNRGELIRKVNFPKMIIVISAIITSILTFLLNLVIILAFLVYSRLMPDKDILFLIPVFIELLVFIVGISLILATLYTKFRDFSHIWEVVLQVGFYSVPILYPISFIPDALKNVIMINPISQIIQDARWALISRDVITSWEVLNRTSSLITLVIVVAVFIVGIWFFYLSSKNFAEQI